ncbi:MAG: MBL fold metallo-hydrolase, partial [Clostridiales bacterium]|nr:MBL fold metallo-hydrolase [Clostridiales bacterium]
VLLKDGEELVLRQVPIRVIHTPGHTIGSTCYYVEEADILVSGDTLFFEDVGRCDLPTSNFESILHSIREKLFILKNETKVYPGHGFSSTIGHEKDNNSYLK